jgi:phosphotransferase system HPr-like phosphotransfer protein
MIGSYDFSIHINNFMQCQCLQAVAQECADVIVIDCNGSHANAKSLLSLMSLDYSRKVRIITSTAEELFALRNALQLK